MKPPALTMSVPIRALADFDAATLRLWLVTNQVAGAMDAGQQPRPLLALLKDELGMAQGAFHRWHRAKWGPPA